MAEEKEREQTPYEKGEITDRERLAAQRQQDIARWNMNTIKNDAAWKIANYDRANKQNRSLADVQLKQNSRKTEADRFDAMRDLQNASLGLFGSMNQAMNGSSVGNLMRMLENRSDKDNQTYWTQHQTNQDQVENAYTEAYNQNMIAMNDVAMSAEKALRDLEGDLAANLNNINPNLYEAPGNTGGGAAPSGWYNSTGGSGGNLGSNDAYLNLQNSYKLHEPNKAKISGYLMPDDSAQAARQMSPRNRLRGDDYYSRLINSFNGR